MNLPTLAAFLIATASVAVPCAAQEDYGCPGPDTSTLFQGCVNMKEAENLEVAISQQLKEIAKLAPSKVAVEQLSASQRDWAKYKDRACNVQNWLMGGANSVSYTRCVLFLTRQRLEYLQSSY